MKILLYYNINMNYWVFLLFIIKCNIISTTSLKFNCSQQIQIEQICDFELNIMKKKSFVQSVGTFFYYVYIM